MSQPEEIPLPDLSATEAALAALAPAPAALDRDRLMFQAGRAAGGAAGWGWPAATGALTALAAALALVMVLRPPVVTETVVVHVPVEVTPAPAPPKPEPDTPADSSPVTSRPADLAALPPVAPGYLRLQDQILRWGLDALPAGRPAAPAEPPITVEQLLGESPRPAQPSPWRKPPSLIPTGGQS